MKSNLARARVCASFRFVDPGLRACDEPERPGAERPAALPRLPAPPGRAAHRLRGRLDGRCADRDMPWAGERGKRCHRTHANQTQRLLCARRTARQATRSSTRRSRTISVPTSTEFPLGTRPARTERAREHALSTQSSFELGLFSGFSCFGLRSRFAVLICGVCLHGKVVVFCTVGRESLIGIGDDEQHYEEALGCP